MNRIKLNPVDVFDIQNLPDVPFRRVLYFLSVKETRNLRLLSKWFERKITFLRKSIFNKFHIKEFNNYRGINEDNCEGISRTLSGAMDKPHAPEELDLKFIGKINQTMRQITVDYIEAITSLDIEVEENNYLLLQPSFLFICLESLTISCNDYNQVKECEAMLNKHANKIRNLKIRHLQKNLRVPDLPKLDSLTLYGVSEEPAWTILAKSRHTITSFVTDCFSIYSPSFNSVVYHVPNINHLSIKNSNKNALKFAIFNADHLVSLELGCILGIPKDVVLPQFPNLRELSILDSRLRPLLMNCRETLERLVLMAIYNDDNEYSGVIMPRLTDLYLFKVNNAFTSKICSNHKSIEFLLLRENTLPNLDDGIKMERMRNVVLGHNRTNYTALDREKMTVMCPNADVALLREENMDEMRDLAKSRCKRRNFSLDVALANHFIES